MVSNRLDGGKSVLPKGVCGLLLTYDYVCVYYIRWSIYLSYLENIYWGRQKNLPASKQHKSLCPFYLSQILNTGEVTMLVGTMCHSNLSLCYYPV